MPKRKSTSQKTARKSKKPKTQKIDIIATAEAENPTNIEELRTLVTHLSKAPLDILGTIFSFLKPYDLLWLARSSKDIRSFLVNESGSRLVREAERLNDKDLPPKPADVDEPAYASLMYDTHCSECLNPDCATVFWEWKKRLCDTCEKSLQLASVDLNFTLDPPLISKDDFLALVPSCGQKITYHVDTTILKLRIKNTEFPHPFWIESVIVGYLAEYNREVKDKTSFSQWKARLEEEKVERNKHTEKCVSWNARKWVKQVDEKRGLINKRYRDIARRLGGRRPTGLRFHPSVNALRTLTDEEFDRIKPTLEAKFPVKPDPPRKRRRDVGSYVHRAFEPYLEDEFHDGFYEFLENDPNVNADFKSSGYDDFMEFLDDFEDLYFGLFSDSGFYDDCLDSFLVEHGYHV